MLTVSNISVMNFENAIRGMRNPMNSWDRMDSRTDENGVFVLGENDRQRAAALCSAGTPDHRKFIRQILVSLDIDAPLYWWKEFDTYKVGTVANSCSTMHKIHSRRFRTDDFSCDQLTPESMEHFEAYITYLESVRKKYLASKSKQDWYDLIQLLPSSYNQLRTVTLNYEVLRNMYHARKEHKLLEWHVLCDAIAALPYADILITGEDRSAQE